MNYLLTTSTPWLVAFIRSHVSHGGEMSRQYSHVGPEVNRRRIAFGISRTHSRGVNILKPLVHGRGLVHAHDGMPPSSRQNTVAGRQLAHRRRRKQ